MTRRVEFEHDGQWADLREPHELTGDDQEKFWDLAERLREEAGDGEVTGKQNRELRDLVLGMAVAGTSYTGLPHPFTPEARRMLPLLTVNHLYNEVDDLYRYLNGATSPDPKTVTTDSGTSTGTSAENAPAPRQEPGEETSATPS